MRAQEERIGQTRWANKMDGRIPSHPISLHLPALMFDTSERSAKGEQARHIQQTTRREDGNAGK